MFTHETNNIKLYSYKTVNLIIIPWTRDKLSYNTNKLYNVFENIT